MPSGDHTKQPMTPVSNARGDGRKSTEEPRKEDEAVGGGRPNRQKSQANQSQSDMHSSHRSRRSRGRFYKKGHDGMSSKLDSVSINSGFMSRATKKRSIRKGGKRSISLAVQNEAIINKIQEQLAEFKSQVNADILVSGATEPTPSNSFLTSF